MKITSSSIAMSAKSNHLETHTKAESLKSWAGNQKTNSENKDPSFKRISRQQLDLLEISEKARKALEESKDSFLKKISSDDYSDISPNDKDNIKIKLLEDFILALTGKKIKLIVPQNIKISNEIPNFNCFTLKGHGDVIQIKAPEKKGWGVEYEYHESNYEFSQMSFDSEGIVKTADGREIDFSLQLNVSREFASQEDISLRMGDAVKVDPLVINFDNPSAHLTSSKISFDIDSDGKNDQISFVNPGSGFLAFDKNNDGIINDGSELFGTKSGDGFADLAKYDADGNNWIDENDEIFNKLRIWTKDENGNDKLFALGEKGIGAIYLGNVDTTFEIKNLNNESQGEIRKTGIFLHEDGTAGTVQHVDLTL